jgi:riboflavin biosynthesis pyrimidine reductase
MKAFESPARVTADGGLELPAEFRQLLRPDASVRVVILVEEPGDQAAEDAWSRLAAGQLLAQYADADEIYDRAP